MVSIMKAGDEFGTLYVVATPIGNLDDLTQRAIQTLSQVDLIIAEDTRHTRKLLSFLGIEKPLQAYHDHNEAEKTEKILQLLQQKKDIALVSDAGTPLISDPGYILVKKCREFGVKVTPIPGVSALVTALSVSGLPTDSFRFNGFPPRQASRRREFFEGFLKEAATLVFYESSHRIKDCLEDAVAVFGEGREACLARELTKLYETVITAPLAELVSTVETDENQLKGEFVLIIQGADVATQASVIEIDSDKVLKILLEELPVKQAAGLTAKITGLKKNQLYQQALSLKK
jgi:16S rRNA (cytidine1402-2'-O)-methyltransferase